MDARTCLAALAALLLAGCAAPPPPTGLDTTDSSQESVQEEAMSVLAHDGPAIVNVTRWANGTFQTYETCNVTGCATGAAYHHLDFTDAFPAGVPVRFRFEFNYPSNPLFRRPMILELETEGVSLYNVTELLERDRTLLTGVVLKGAGTIRATILYGSPVYGSGATVDYTLRLDVTGGNEWTPGGVPLLVRLSPGTETIATTSYGFATATVFAPDDSPLGRWDGAVDGLRLRVPDDRPAGDYVLVFPETVQAVQVRSNDSQATLRALPVVVERGEPHPVEGLDPIVWSFTLDRPPLLIGLYEQNAQELIAEAASSPVEVRSPAGVVLEGTLGCDGLCVTGAHEVMLRSAAVDPGLVAGKYDARYESAGSAGLHVGHFVMSYER